MSTPPPPKVTIDSATITGKHIPSSPSTYPTAVEAFYNIPYATCRRFQPPEPLPLPPSSPLDGSKPGPSQPTPFSPGPTAESPLTLNIFRPASPSSPTGPDEKEDAGASKSLRPVIVFLHGGGFNFGSPLDGDQASFVSWGSFKGNSEVVVVSASYRLGALGFLGEQGSELNLGLRDQRVAIDWVRRWIKHWGGDGDRITVRGVSAGAHSIGYHILNPKSLGISKFILESGSPTSRSVLHPSHPRVTSQLQALKKNGKSAPLQTLSVDGLINNAVMVFGDNSQPPTWPFQPVIDTDPTGAGEHATIPDMPLNLWDDFLKADKGKDISVITGFCSHEGVDFVPARGYNTGADFRKWFQLLLPTFTDADLDTLEALYPDPATAPSSSPYANTGAKCKQWKRMAEAYAHYAYICPVLHTAHALSQAGARVYVYEFAWRAPPHDMAGHASQSWVVERALDDGGKGSGSAMAALAAKPAGSGPAAATLADEMNWRWVSFVAEGDGDLGDLWPRFESLLESSGDGEARTEGWGKILVFGGESGAVQERELTPREKEVCRFWWERMELSQGLGKKGEARRKY